MAEVRSGEKRKVKEPPAGRWRALALIVSAVVLAAVGGWLWANRGKEASAQASAQTQIRSTTHLETFVLNLADTNQRSYLRVGIDLGLTRELKRGDDPPPVAEVRDTILGVLAEEPKSTLSCPPKARRS